MAKAKLTSMTKGWIEGKTEKQNDGKPLYRRTAKVLSPAGDLLERMKQTVYLSKAANKRLWHHRAETGDTISETVEGLVMEHLGKQ